MTTLVIPVKRPPMTSNEQRRWHWRTVYARKKLAEQLVFFAAKRARIGTLTVPQSISVTWYAPDARRRDSDALGPFLKASLDALVTAQVLRDDSAKFVTETRMRIDIDRTNPRIEIVLEESK